jgi:hypothetical protein
MQVRATLLFALAAGLGVLACSSDSSGPQDDGFAECLDVAFAATSGLPLDEVDVGHAPANFEEPLAARMFDADGDAVGYAPVLVDESGQARVVVPLHPVTPLEGGPVQLALADSLRQCAPVDFTIESLPEAEGEVASIVELLGDMLDQAAVLLGTSNAELLATPLEQLAPVHYPLAVALDVLQNPDNSYSLAAILDGSSPLSDADGLVLADRLFARTGVRENLGPATAAARAGQPLLVEDPGVECTPEYVGDDAGRLDACMDLALDITSSIAGATGQILEDLSELFAVGTLAPHPAVEVTSAIAGLAVYIVQTRRAKLAAFLPSSLTAMDADFGQTDYLEDEPGPGKIEQAQVRASSSEWDMGKAIIEGALAAAGFFRELQQFGGAEALNDVGVYLVSQGVIPWLLGDETLDDFTVDPIPFGPVDVLAEAWSDISVPLGEAIEVTTYNVYEPKKVGTATLLIHTTDGEFGGQRVEAAVEVTVRQLTMQVYPDEVVLEPGEITYFSLSVENSLHPDSVDFLPGLEIQGSADITIEPGQSSHPVSYTAPESPDPEHPDLLTFVHTATGGARGGDAPPRTATVTIRFGGVRITTQPRCVDIDEDPFQIGVEVAGGIQDPVLIWEASAGEIDANGVFTPPDEAQLVTITVSLAANPNLKDQIELPVGGCSCSATINIGGSSDVTTGLRFFLSNDLSGVQAFDWKGANFSQATFGFGANPAEPQVIPFNTTGAFDGGGSGILNAETSFANPDDLDNPTIDPLTVILEENTGSVLTGSVSGTVSVGADPEPIEVPLSLTFRIEADPYFSTESMKVCEVPSS